FFFSFFFSSRRRHTRWPRDWSSDVCSSDLNELGPEGITVNCVAPGRIETARLAQLYPGGPTEEQIESIPLRRWGQPSEFADVVEIGRASCRERGEVWGGVGGCIDNRKEADA